MKKTPGHFEPKIEVLETFSSIEFSFSFVLDVRCFICVEHMTLTRMHYIVI